MNHEVEWVPIAIFGEPEETTVTVTRVYWPVCKQVAFHYGGDLISLEEQITVLEQALDMAKHQRALHALGNIRLPAEDEPQFLDFPKNCS